MCYTAVTPASSVSSRLWLSLYESDACDLPLLQERWACVWQTHARAREQREAEECGHAAVGRAGLY